MQHRVDATALVQDVEREILLEHRNSASREVEACEIARQFAVCARERGRQSERERERERARESEREQAKESEREGEMEGGWVVGRSRGGGG